MDQLFKIQWPSPKSKYYLLYSSIDKATGHKYSDDLFKNAVIIDIKNELIIEKSWGKNFADFHHGIGDAPYINENFIECLKNVGEKNYQLIPVSVLPEEKTYYILNILNMIDCVDREKSKFTLWTEEDNRPDILGDYHSFDEMILDRKLVPEGVHIFRLKGYEVITVITKELLNEFKKKKITGFTTKPVG
ncbi:imm11 family protein [Silvanigrella aquatica]|uniref:Immunity MXAN-0049 protein domain-containing protein n=1 Tax=Silvanigrella aquatica TaxID=1915309 RepID=A0A1L4D1W7_9BACT|nr:DUF1629 domain-containing protein [Silvanigrella aquatica]APJ04187.1 hypothetical protein AXG55_09830 [Silvanigrella aquatica]